MKTIAVNAYPLHNSGGLSILEQLIRGIECYSQDCGYLLFVHPGVRVKTTAKTSGLSMSIKTPLTKSYSDGIFRG